MQHQHIRSTVEPLPGVKLGNRVNPHIYTFGEICHQLGLLRRSAHYRTEYIRTMIEKVRFPAPLPRFTKASGDMQTGAGAVTPNSNWNRPAVDAWFNGLLPPDARAAIAGLDIEGQALDDRAGNINELLAKGA